MAAVEGQPAVEESNPLPAAGAPPEQEWQTPMPEGVPPELEQEILAIAPSPPDSVNVNDPEDVARWEMCSRIAAVAAIYHGDQASESDRRSFAWQAARVLYHSDTPLEDLPSKAAEPSV